MTKRGKHSSEWYQRRLARRYVIESADHHPWDLYRETVNTLTQGQIAARLQEDVGTFSLTVIGQYDQGEVLEDPYARGTLQKVDVPK